MNWPSPVNSKTFSGGIMKTTQRQKLQPVFCPAYKMCSYKSSREIIEVTNQWLVHLETYTMRSSSPPDIAWRARNQRQDNPET